MAPIRSRLLPFAIAAITVGFTVAVAACQKSAGLTSDDAGLFSAPAVVCPVPTSEAVNDVYPESAVPTGSCTPNEACTLQVQRAACGCANVVSEYVCQCLSDQWQCAIINQDSTACTCDGGADGALESDGGPGDAASDADATTDAGTKKNPVP